MDPKYAPYKCPCGRPFWVKEDFRTHIADCPDSIEFIKIFKQYQQLAKTIVDPEDLR